MREDLILCEGYQKFNALFLLSIYLYSGTIAGVEYTARQHGPGKKSIAK